MPSVGDSPIHERADDLLQRLTLVDAFVRQVFAVQSSEGVVAGVLGPWGSGKTSFLNLARSGLGASSCAVIDFNPWMFSGAEQLIDRFFIEVAAQLKLKPGLDETAKRVLEYGDAFAGLGWLPVVGTWIERGRLIAGGAKKLLDRRNEGIGARRQALEKALAGLDQPIVVVLDDIDRLTTPEIRDVFKLVRLTANFPKIIYIVAFDRHRVEAALNDDGIPGRDYLEKILAFGLDLPPVPQRVLPRLVTDAIDEALAGVAKVGPFDSKTWTDLLYEVVLPQIRNVRDIRRYAAALRPTVDQLAGAVALADVLALESVRVFTPDVFVRFHASVDVLTSTSDLGLGRVGDDQSAIAAIRELVEVGGQSEAVVRALLSRLFPASQKHLGGSHYGSEWKKTWLRDRRVANQVILRRYLEAVNGPELEAFDLAERAWALFDDPPGLDAFLRSLEPEVLTDVLTSLDAFEEDFGPEHVRGVVVVLLNLPRPRQLPKGPFSLDARMIVSRLVLRLFWAVTPRHAEAVNADKTEPLVLDALPLLESLSAQLELLTIVGHEAGAGHKLVREDFARDRQSEWAARADSASASALATEPDLVRVLLQRAEWAPSGSPAEVLPDAPTLTLLVLSGALRNTHSWSMDSRNVRTSKRLAWDTIVTIFGGEDAVRSRLEELRSADLPDPDGALELAERYLAGWRPQEFS
ncbi:MAG: KAP family P-loop NTPase fold protein [Cellulomonas sp.]